MNLNHASTFAVPFGTHSLVGDIFSNNSSPDAVVLHGAGRSGRHRFYSIRAKLLERGISSLAFDMVGHGDTGGIFAESSLKDRTLQAVSVIKHWKFSEPLSFIGASMGGYTAVKLTQNFDVQNLILFVPAMYSRRAYSLCFNDNFSKVIREQNSWFDSDAWDILNNFKGNLMLITAENDDIIPEDVVKKILDSATKANNKVIHEVKESPHQILSYLAGRPQEFMEVIEQIISFLDEGSEK